MINDQLSAYYITFNIENKIRVAIHNKMINLFGVGYFNEHNIVRFKNKNISNNYINIVKDAYSLKEKEKKYSLQLEYDYPLLWYINYKPLIAFLDTYYNFYFYDVFHFSDKTLINNLYNISHIRNALAHHRYISKKYCNILHSANDHFETCINNKYLYNYETIAVKPLNELIDRLKDINHKICDYIKDGYIITGELKAEWESVISTIYNINEYVNLVEMYEDLQSLLVQYNKLDRRPGQYDKIKHFVDKNNIYNKLEKLTKCME